MKSSESVIVTVMAPQRHEPVKLSLKEDLGWVFGLPVKSGMVTILLSVITGNETLDLLDCFCTMGENIGYMLRLARSSGP